jgi:hypothetical protein
MLFPPHAVLRCQIPPAISALENCLPPPQFLQEVSAHLRLSTGVSSTLDFNCSLRFSGIRSTPLCYLLGRCRNRVTSVSSFSSGVRQ